MIAEAVEVPAWAFQVAAWSAGVGAILAAAIKLVPKFSELYMRLRNAIKSVDDDTRARLELRASLLNIRRVAAIEGLCRQWVVSHGAQRALGLIANNGGEAWKGTGPLYLNNPAQAVGAGSRDTRDEWQEWEADAWYIGFLGRLLESYQEKRCYLLVADQDVDGELKRAYKRQGTVASLIIPFMWRTGSQLWFISINFGRPLHDAEEDIPEEEKIEHLNAAREVFNNPGRCRALVDTARGVYNSIR